MSNPENTQPPRKLLIIDDLVSIHTLIRARLASEGLEIHSAYDGETGLRLAAEVQPDLILLDVEMPEPSGFEVCRRLKSNAETMNTLIVFLTGATSTDEKIRGLNLGAVDYITKPFDSAELRARVRACLRTKYLLDLLAKKAMVDGLTGLWNRAYLDTRLGGELSLARRTGRSLACTLIDVDHFKAINDAYGHPFGDEVLRRVASVFLHECRTEDVVCRYGGEEFLVLTPNVGTDGAGILAERLRLKVAALRFKSGEREVRITCSFGISEFAATDTPLVVAADKALYQAKAAGRNCVVKALGQQGEKTAA